MNRTRRSLLISFGEKYALMAIGVAGSMVIARLLTPHDIGVYSVAAVLLGMAQVLRDFGAGQYIVQAKVLDETRLRAVLAVNLLFAWTLAAIVALCARRIAHIYSDARLLPLLQVMACTLLFIPFSAVTLPMLRRAHRFGAVCCINLANGVAGVLTGVTLAWHGYGYMSLAWAALASALATLLASQILRPAGMPWLPGVRGIGEVLAFGAYATGGNLVDEAGVVAPDLVIGKVIGMEAVGVFGKANGALAVFHQAVTSAVSPVVYSLYASEAREGRGARSAYLCTVSYLTALAWPFYACLAILALPVVRLLYGTQWDASAPLIRIMCFSAALYSTSSMARYLFLAAGHVRAQARLDMAAVAFRVLVLLAAAPFGLKAVAVAVIAGTMWRAWLTLQLLGALNNIEVADVVRASIRSLLLAAFVCAGPGMVMVCIDGDALQLALGAVAAMLLWFTGVGLLHHPLQAELLLVRRKLAMPFSSW